MRRVGTTYANGSQNTLRRIKMIYPSDTAGTTTYAEDRYVSEAADKLSRSDRLGYSGGDSVEYSYLGFVTPVEVDYVSLNQDVGMSYTSPSGTNPGGDQYSGLDQFGRVIGIKWNDGTDDLVDATYGYDRAGNRKWRRDEKAHSLTNGEETKHDNFYWYDGLYQVGDWERGDLAGTRPDYTGITGTPQRSQGWCYDETGNWQTFDDSEGPLAQTRSHNVDNEITSITNPGGVVQPAYDDLGNMTTSPKPGAWGTSYTLKWDAWNRLVEVKEGSTVVQTNAYDGLHRRTTEDDGTDTRHFYYDRQWRPVEEFLNTDTTPQSLYLWGLRSRWDLVGRTRSSVTRWVLYDAMDPVAIIDQNSDVAERYEYTPFGETEFMDASFVSRTSTSENWNFLFHSEFQDVATGLYNYGYRYYHPQLGRWLSRDPITDNYGNNRYHFVLNNSLRNLDLFGLNEADIGYLIDQLKAEFEEWGEGDETLGNCLRWVLKDKKKGKERPKVNPPGWDSEPSLTPEERCKKLMDALMKMKGFEKPEVGNKGIVCEKGGSGAADKCCKLGYVCISVQAGNQIRNPDTLELLPDFHFARLEAPGVWTHKQGKSGARFSTGVFAGDGLTPGSYLECGRLCVKEGVDADKLIKKPSESNEDIGAVRFLPN